MTTDISSQVSVKQGLYISSKTKLNGRQTLLLMAIPCFVLLLAFYYVPIFGWIIAFVDYQPAIGILKSQFSGLKWFEMALLQPELLTVLRNTLVMSALGLLLSPLGPVFAIFLNEIQSRKFKKVVQTITTFPNFISWILVFSVFFTFFATGDGLFNNLLLRFHLIDKPVDVLGNPDIVWFVQTAVLIWKGLGFSAIVYLAAISGIDPQLYDAAEVDGASRFGKIIHITVPGMTATYITLLILAIASILNNGFEQYYLFNNAMVHDKIQVLDYYVYRIGITLGSFSLSTAVGITKTIISIILLTTANSISKRIRGTAIF